MLGNRDVSAYPRNYENRNWDSVGPDFPLVPTNVIECDFESHTGYDYTRV